MLVLTDLALALRIVFAVATLVQLVVAAIPALIDLLHLILILLECCLIVVEHHVFLRASVLVVRRLLARCRVQLPFGVATSCPETLLVKLAIAIILTVSFLLL